MTWFQMLLSYGPLGLTSLWLVGWIFIDKIEGRVHQFGSPNPYLKSLRSVVPPSRDEVRPPSSRHTWDAERGIWVPPPSKNPYIRELERYAKEIEEADLVSRQTDEIEVWLADYISSRKQKAADQRKAITDEHRRQEISVLALRIAAMAWSYAQEPDDTRLSAMKVLCDRWADLGGLLMRPELGEATIGTDTPSVDINVVRHFRHEANKTKYTKWPYS